MPPPVHNSGTSPVCHGIGVGPSSTALVTRPIFVGTASLTRPSSAQPAPDHSEPTAAPSPPVAPVSCEGTASETRPSFCRDAPIHLTSSPHPTHPRHPTHRPPHTATASPAERSRVPRYWLSRPAWLRALKPALISEHLNGQPYLAF